MKNLILLIAICFSGTSFAQMNEVKFREEAFDNGMNYPVIIVPDAKNVEDSINSHLRKGLADLEESEFCIGQYGYVQKSTHLQIHVFCNCIDFDESENRFFLFNLETGDQVPYSDMVNPKKKDMASIILLDFATKHASNNGLVFPDGLENEIRSSNLDAFNAELKREGIELWLKDNSWNEKRLFIKWLDLKPVLKYHFI